MQVRMRVMIVMIIAAAFLGCTQKPPPATDVIEDKAYTVTPDLLKLNVGIVTGEVTEMKVTERIERDSGRIDSPARFTGKMKLTNNSTDHSVRLMEATIQYIDAEGQVIRLEGSRTEPKIRFSPFGSDRLDPGRDATQIVDVNFPTAALELKRLKEIHIDLIYVSSLFVKETANLAVSIGGQ